MYNYSLIKVVNKKEPLTCEYLEDFFIVGDKYILLGDSPINIEGELLWKSAWQHSPSRVVYIEEKDILITDRVTMIGPCTLRQGICAVDINTGKYLWKHFYENGLEERRAMKTGKPDINLVKCIGKVNFEEGYIYTCGFRIKVEDGTYEYIEKDTTI